MDDSKNCWYHQKVLLQLVDAASLWLVSICSVMSLHCILCFASASLTMLTMIYGIREHQKVVASKLRQDQCYLRTVRAVK
jgi:hypothetical protein